MEVTPADDRNNFYLGEILVAPQHNRISLGERSLKLQPKVMAVLAYLAQHQERVISAEELMDALWKGRVVTQSSVQKSMNSLRGALVELAGEREFVAHFSKRGYQLVVPARFPESAPPRAPENRRARALRPLALTGVAVAIAALAGLIWLLAKPRGLELPPRTHAILFEASAGFTSETGHERGAEPHPDGERVAYVREVRAGDDSHNQSQIQIRDRKGHDWLLASVDGSWVHLAWSPSGRNLVAVEMRRAEGLPPSPAYFEAPNYLYSFHIFTLDFSGRRLVEKNLLSQWQGAIESVTWWDENTIEFVASQGPNSTNERYRYIIAEQRLSMLNPLTSGFEPQSSAVREKRSAVVSRRGNAAQLEFLDAQQQAVAVWPLISGDMDISWIPDGSGVLALEQDSGDLSAFYLDGESAPIQFVRDRALSISHPRYSGGGQSILLSAATERMGFDWLDPQGQRKPLSQGDYGNGLPRFSPDATRLVFASTRNNQHQIWEWHQGQEKQLATAEKPVTQILWLGNDFLLYRSGWDIWLYEFGGGVPQRLEEKAARLDLVAYDPATRDLWLVKAAGDARNLWQKNLAAQTEKQLTFGTVAAVAAHRGHIYFQYRDQRGLWVLDGGAASPRAISARLPANSRLLRAVDGGVYFVTGGACRESAIQFLDFTADTITTVLERAHDNVMSQDFHPAAGVLYHDCALPESNIIELQSRKPAP